MSGDGWHAGPPADAAFVELDARFDVRTAPEIMALPDPPPEYELLGPLVYRGSRTIIVGDTGHGKTSFALRMLRAILLGEPMLGHVGAGVGPALVLDLEQGIRSIKRGLVESGLAELDELLYVSAPDGLALDQDLAHLAALNAVLAEHRPVAVLLDPYYKAHRAADSNAEREIIDLMRQLDALRVIYEFALLLPAHPRKRDSTAHGARTLTIHDVAGSGAVTRGAEIVLGLERLGHGAARLRYLKDRDGDLPIGDAAALLYSREEGFRLDPRDTVDDLELERRIHDAAREWSTLAEWSKALAVRQGTARRMLDALAARDDSPVAYAVGPPGRKANAQCWTSVPGAREYMGIQEHLPAETSSVPGVPSSLKGGDTVREHFDGTNGSGTLAPGDELF